ncbi:hypothetical protein INR49_013535 [Caranx melampygus]|nr:hypothetical protein INR49_013535 [Caranx melampygus]
MARKAMIGLTDPGMNLLSDARGSGNIWTWVESWRFTFNREVGAQLMVIHTRATLAGVHLASFDGLHLSHLGPGQQQQFDTVLLQQLKTELAEDLQKGHIRELLLSLF